MHEVGQQVEHGAALGGLVGPGVVEPVFVDEAERVRVRLGAGVEGDVDVAGAERAVPDAVAEAHGLVVGQPERLVHHVPMDEPAAEMAGDAA